jgi:hypothetical protein
MRGAALPLVPILSLLSAVAVADEVFLKGGGRVSGVIVERSERTLVVEAGPGRVTIPLARVESIVEGESALDSFRQRAASLDADDTAGWVALARFAQANELATQAREAWTRVLAVDPRHPEANRALGRVELDGVWMGEDEAMRARGYVLYEGRWMSPAEHEALVMERVAREAADSERAEARARVREAEARAREAEARAREAEALAAGAEEPLTEGIPYWWVLHGGGPLVCLPGSPCPPTFLPPHPPRGTPPARPPHARPTARPPSKPPTAGLQPTRSQARERD